VGKEDEWEYVEDLGMDPRVGSHPFQIIRTARRYGLSVQEHCPMSRDQLLRYLRDRRPVMLMIQAWGEEAGRAGFRRSYQDIWSDGHWVVAIGFDRHGVFFEDPSLQAIRGYLRFDELARRWRDTGPYGKRMRAYGLAVWKPRFIRSAYTSRAQRIG
jgi:hypothetical protein